MENFYQLTTLYETVGQLVEKIRNEFSLRNYPSREAGRDLVAYIYVNATDNYKTLKAYKRKINAIWRISCQIGRIYEMRSYNS